jgi:hypothetical protein
LLEFESKLNVAFAGLREGMRDTTMLSLHTAVPRKFICASEISGGRVCLTKLSKEEVTLLASLSVANLLVKMAKWSCELLK